MNDLLLSADAGYKSILVFLCFAARWPQPDSTSVFVCERSFIACNSKLKSYSYIFSCSIIKDEGNLSWNHHFYNKKCTIMKQYLSSLSIIQLRTVCLFLGVYVCVCVWMCLTTDCVGTSLWCYFIIFFHTRIHSLAIITNL